MNDCFYYFIGCDGGCYGCPHYASVNTDQGYEMLEQYRAEVDAARAPIRDKWMSKKGGE